MRSATGATSISAAAAIPSRSIVGSREIALGRTSLFNAVADARAREPAKRVLDGLDVAQTLLHALVARASVSALHDRHQEIRATGVDAIDAHVD